MFSKQGEFDDSSEDFESVNIEFDKNDSPDCTSNGYLHANIRKQDFFNSIQPVR